MAYRDPTPHPSGARPPVIPAAKLPKHVAIVMDGNGRWAKQRGLKRTEGGAQRTYRERVIGLGIIAPITYVR